MMGYIFLFLIGFGLAVSGGVMLIAYMNFLLAGGPWMEYFMFVLNRFWISCLRWGYVNCLYEFFACGSNLDGIFSVYSRKDRKLLFSCRFIDYQFCYLPFSE